ncbi:unnamed protein product [Protopolystoma xenopodis]|uniref:Uncharacterized protein n=1 Tax=Protopolystoma xenopodis TaxID=117903 RepID=A0A448XFY6_9PLAT|nr:unnamed protein product [Protopolystoma xenopodis]
MAKLTDDADYDAGETFENVSSPFSDAGTHGNYYGRRLRTSCAIIILPILAHLFTHYPLIALTTYSSSRVVPFLGNCGMATSHLGLSCLPPSRFTDPTQTYSDLPHGLVDLILIFLVDRVHSFPPPV